MMITHSVIRSIYGILALGVLVSCQVATQPSPTLTKIGENISFRGEQTQLQTHSDGRHNFVTGFFGEKGPYNIIVDTGAGPNVIDQRLAKEMGLKKIGEKEVLSGGVRPVMTDVVIVPHLRVNGLSIENAEFITIGLGEMSMGQFHGVLGMELFSESFLTFDPRHDRIGISHAELSASDPDVIPYDADQDSGFKVEILVAGQPVKMNLDTGAPSTFTFPLALQDTLPLQDELTKGPDAQLVGGKRSLWQGTLDGTLQFGKLNFINPAVIFMDPSAPYGNIGNAILGDIVLGIDQRNKLISLRQSTSVETNKVVVSKTNGAPRKLGIQLRGMGGGALSVTWIEPGSLGERAGFKTGDVLVNLNGQPAKEYDMKALGGLFRSATPLVFEVDREGELHKIEIH